MIETDHTIDRSVVKIFQKMLAVGQEFSNKFPTFFQFRESHYFQMFTIYYDVIISASLINSIFKIYSHNMISDQKPPLTKISPRKVISTLSIHNHTPLSVIRLNDEHLVLWLSRVLFLARKFKHTNLHLILMIQ